jgi:8-oxo-dGTP pyrophosphatase MutT (NUDIX family)
LAIPVVGVDHHLPAIAEDLLSASALRQCFKRSHDAAGWTPEFASDTRGHDLSRDAAQAAVLIPLVQRDDGLHVLLTRRTAHLKSHAGQISFPGGRAEPDDDDAIVTALREAEEEVGLPRSACEILGTLPCYVTITRFEVTPVVALVRPPLSLVLDAFEVAEAFEVPLRFLMNPAHHRRHAYEWEGGRHQFLSMPWRPGPSAAPEYLIWGATAAMLRNLYGFLSR